MPAPVLPFRRLLFVSIPCSLLAAAGLHAQQVDGDPLHGTVDLGGGFAPDPWVVTVAPGGDTAVADLGAGCSGFIGTQPDLRVEYREPAADLGVFVYSGVDTTLVVHDPAGNWHCSDDASFLGGSNPGLVVNAPPAGTYEIWVGTYEEGAGGAGKLVLTERDSSQWLGMDIGNGTGLIADGIDFGDDLGTWATDGECDDPRFAGSGAADTLLDVDRYHDASDCAEAWAAGTIWLATAGVASDARSGEAGGDAYEASLTLENAGTLSAGDATFSNGEYYDSYTFQGRPGQTVTIDLDSADFDTYLVLGSPDGQRTENDDAGGAAHSRIVARLSQPGTYIVYVTSYAAGETGAYTIAVNQADESAEPGSAIVLPPDSGGDVYGIFAGIADYPGDDNDLERTDEDALRVRDALIDGAGMDPSRAWMLLDSDATKANVAAALRSIGTSIGADDTLVIFYSGHGGQHARAGGPNAADPDGMDESLVLYDGELLDDELAAMLDELGAGRVLLVLDSCYSGGFAKDVVSAPGRMGLFSSEEDVNSHVAWKFEAGGYLSVFFDDAVRGRLADGDGNRQLTALELSEYIHARYRVDVDTEAAGAGSARATGPASSYQHLVVDRGGVAANSVLFRH